MESSFVELIEIGKSRVSKEDIDIDNLKPNEAIIKASYSMISAGTELSRAFAIKKGFSYPVRPGYSTVGKVLAKGADLDINVGDKVFVDCPHASLIRWDETYTTQGHSIYKIPQDIDDKQATAINLCLVAIQGVNLTKVNIGDTVAVIGLGNIGIITALMYQKLGARVIGLDPVEQRCKLANSMGLKYTSFDLNQVDTIKSFTNNKGADIVVDVTGVAQAIITAINSAKQYGQVVLLGSPRQGYECDITPVLNKIHMNNLKVIGAFNNTAPVKQVEGSDNSVEKNITTVCEMIKNKEIDIDKLISKVIDPINCEQAYYDLMYNKDKVNCIVFDWTNY